MARKMKNPGRGGRPRAGVVFLPFVGTLDRCGSYLTASYAGQGPVLLHNPTIDTIKIIVISSNSYLKVISCKGLARINKIRILVHTG